MLMKFQYVVCTCLVISDPCFRPERGWGKFWGDKNLKILGLVSVFCLQLKNGECYLKCIYILKNSKFPVSQKKIQIQFNKEVFTDD